MLPKRLSGYILGSLVGIALLYTAGVGLNAAFRSQQTIAAGPVGLDALDSLGENAIGGAAAVAQPGIPTADFGSRLLSFGKSILDFIVAHVETVGKAAVKQGLRLYLGNLARGTAEWIANGGTGQKPLFQYKDFGSFLADQGDAAAAQFLDTLGTKYGVNVCNPQLGAKLVIHAGLGLVDTPLQNPRCTLDQIQDNWAALAPDSKTFLSRFSVAFEPSQNDLGVALKLQENLVADRNRAEQASILTRLEDQGLKAVTSLNGLIKTPSFAVGSQIREALGLSAKSELAFIGDPVADAMTIFVNSLGSKLLDKWLKGGFVNVADLYSQASGNGSLFGGVGNVSTAEPRFAALADVNFGKAGTVDVLSQLSSCANPRAPTEGSECVIENGFRQAVEQQLTVAEAIKRGLLHPEWPFGYNDDGSQPAYNSGYPYSSAVVLRSKRILPVGWELAAQVALAIHRSVTLQEVLHCYEDPTAPDDATKPVDCRQASLDPANPPNPFYHLVDPNWALKAPQAYCTRRGSGQQLLVEQFVCDSDNNGDGTIDCVNYDSSTQLGRPDPKPDEPDGRDQYHRLLQRVEYCADEQSCVAEKPDGSCLAYGYCYQEQPTFNLGGQSCPSYFASCIGVTTPAGQRTAYIKDSLQTCPSSAAGCTWYSRRTNAAGDWRSDEASRIYLNSQAPSCNPEDAGCRTLLRFGQGTNLVPNGGFEQYDKHVASLPSQPDNFFIVGGSAAGQAATNPGDVQEGQSSFRLTTAGDFEVRVDTGSSVASRTFTASVASKGCSGSLALRDEEGNALGTAANLALASGNDQWHTKQLTGVSLSPGSSLTLQLNGLSGANCFLDSLNVAEGSEATTLAYGAGRAIHVKATAKQCSPDDVGCQAYTPANGDPTVYGRVSASDQCPAQCVGYQSFSGLPTGFEIQENPTPPAPTSANFIPSTARACTAATVGCSEFTNLGEVPAGGERVSYFSQAQQCVVESDPNVGTYYTWEGSDTSGYQLRIWHLLNSPVHPLEGGTMPCTNLSLDPAIQPPVCTDAAATPATCTASDADPDCREVFDSNATSHRLLWSRVVQAVADCQPYRRTGTNFVYHTSRSLAVSCPAAAAGCRQYRGPTAGNTRTVLRADFESASAAGWSGSGGQIALTTEALQVGGHSLMVAGAAGAATLHRTEAIAMQPGHQYILTAWVKGTDRDVPAAVVGLGPTIHNFFARLGHVNRAAAQPGPDNLVFNASANPVNGEWQLVRVGPVVPPSPDATTMTFDLQLALGAGVRSVFVDNLLVKEVTSDVFVVENSWNTPQACDNPPGLPNGNDTSDRTEPGAMVGCSQYRLAGRMTTLRSFTRLCEQSNVGCQAFIDTSNSSSPFEQRFNRTCTLTPPVPATRPTVCNGGTNYDRCVVGVGSTSCRYTETASLGLSFFAGPNEPEDQVTVPGDRVVYVVDNPATYCADRAVGCTALGLPDINKRVWDGTAAVPPSGIAGWSDQYRMVEPDKFSQTLCLKDQLWCAAHPLADGGSLTFKNPQATTETQSLTCEYRTGVDVGGTLQSGWFKTASNPPVACATGYTLPLVGASGGGYDGYAGICPTRYNGCTNYVNPQPSKTGGEIDNFYLRSGVDAGSCNGLVDLAGGCLLFSEAGQPELYDSTLSYPPNRLPGQAPVSSAANDANVILKVRRDRMCAAWYTCRDSVTITDASGNIKTVCSGIASCSRLDPNTGQCANVGGGPLPVGSAYPATPGEFTFVSPQDSSRWQNLSGYTVAGIQIGSTAISRGQIPLSYMPQVGDAIDLTLLNGGFDDQRDNLVTSDGKGWSNCSVRDTSATTTSDTACVYTTVNGQVRDGTAALKLVTNAAERTILSHDPVPINPGNTYALSAYVNTQDLSGEDSSGVPASLHVYVRQTNSSGVTLSYNEVATAIAGLSWQQYLVRFDAVANARQMSIELYLKDNAVGNAFVDNVRLEPVLQLDGSPRFTGQQCRVYPRSDAPSCRYQLPDALYRGINGYCIQPDPRDIGRCLQWWPVDLVAGQSFDLFGSTNLSLNLPDPLRYCTESSGNANTSGSYWQNAGFHYNQFGGQTSASLTYYCDPDNTDNTAGDWPPCRTLQPDESAIWYNQDDHNIFDPSWDPRRDSPLWDMRWDEIAAINLTSDRGGDFGMPYRFLGSLATYHFEAHEPTIGYNLFGYWSGWRSTSQGEGWFFLGVDRFTGKINRFLGYANDTHGDGEGGTMNVDLARKEQCAVVAEVANGTDNAAWFNRYQGGWTDAATLVNTPSDDASPYGALSYTDERDLLTRACDPGVLRPQDQPAGSTIAIGCPLPVGRYHPPLAGRIDRAGTPLACNGSSTDCPGMQCSTDPANRCDSADAINRCLNGADNINGDKSYCIGYPASSATRSTPLGTRTNGAVRLSEMFARSYATWTINPDPHGTGAYSSPTACPNAASTDSYSGHSFNYVNGGNGCWDLRWLRGGSSVPAVTDITVQNATSGSVTRTVGQSVELRFASRVDADHKPLQYICIDWGDGSGVHCNGSKLNIDHQPNIQSGHRFTWTYASPGTYVPKVQIEDNWGFCNVPTIAPQYALTQDDPGCTSGSSFLPGTFATSPVTINITP